DAQGGEALFGIALLHLVEQRHQDASAGRADRMPDRDRAAVDVNFIGVPAEILVHGAGLRGEGFIGLHEIEVANIPAGFLSAAREEGIGPVPMILGSTPAWAHDTMRASGVLPSLAASLAFISTTAAAPSLMPDALPAVTVPSLSKAGRNLLIASSVVP